MQLLNTQFQEQLILRLLTTPVRIKYGRYQLVLLRRRSTYLAQAEVVGMWVVATQDLRAGAAA